VRQGVARFSGTKLRAARDAVHLTWDALAARLGVSRVLVQHWAAGRRKPTAEQLPRLAHALGIAPDDLLDPPPADPTLAELRTGLHLTQAELARRLGLPRSSYAALEAGREGQLSDTLANRLAELLAVPAEAVQRAHRKAVTANEPIAGMTRTQARHNALRPALPAATAARPVTRQWLLARIQQYLELANVDAHPILDAEEYEQRTGRPPDPGRAGEIFRGPPADPVRPPLLYLNPTLLPTCAEADRLIAHEVMHLRWPSYGHKREAFARAQQLLDTVPPPLIR